MRSRSAAVPILLALSSTAAHGQADLLLREAMHLAETCPDVELNVVRLEEITTALAATAPQHLSESGDGMLAVITPAPARPPVDEEKSEESMEPTPPAALDPCDSWADMFGPDGWAFPGLLQARR